MEHTVTHQFDRRFIRTGLMRDHVWRSVYYLGATTVAFAAILGWLYWRHGRIHPLPLSVMVVGYVAILLALAYRFRKLVETTFQLWTKLSPDNTISYRLDAAAITVQLGQSTTSYEWNKFRRLWRYDDVWLLEIVRNRSVLFPVTTASDVVKEFLVERCRAMGVRT